MTDTGPIPVQPLGDLHDLADAINRGEIEPTEDQIQKITELKGADWRTT